MAAQAYGNERGVSEGVRAAGEIAAVAKRYGVTNLSGIGQDYGDDEATVTSTVIPACE